LLCTLTSSAAIRFWSIFAAAMMVFGAKLWLIGVFGSATPFWDQWDAEALQLFKPYLEGKLHLSQLFDAHNEHRIFFTRVIALTLLELNGYWDTIFQMVVNAVIHVTAVALLLTLLIRALPLGHAVLLSIFTGLLFALPFGWENSLGGFQSQFYLLLLFAVACHAMLYDAAVFSLKWLIGIALAVGSFFSLASGALTLLSVAALFTCQLVLGKRAGAKEVIGIVLVAALAVQLLLSVPTVTGHDALRAKTSVEFLTSFFRVAAWPLKPSIEWPLPSGMFLCLLLNAPVLVLCFRMIRNRPNVDDPRWFYLGLAGWLFAQCASLAYGRAPVVVGSRYIDLLAFMVIVNFAAIGVVCADRRAGAHACLVATAVWIVPIVLALGDQAVFPLPYEVAHKGATGQIQTQNLKSFLETGDVSHISNKQILHVPYPDSERLSRIASDPTIRSILPPSLDANRTSSLLDPREKPLLRRVLAVTSARLKSVALVYGPLLIPLGVALFLLIGLWWSSCGEPRHASVVPDRFRDSTSSRS